jgi:hypothetical protein
LRSQVEHHWSPKSIRSSMRAQSEFELPVQLLDLVECQLVLALLLLLVRDRVTLGNPVAQSLITNENVHGIAHACARRGRNEAIEQDEVGRQPPMTRNIALAGRSRVVPARGIGGMQGMPLFPGNVELALGCKDNEVHVAEVVRFAACERAEENNSQERRSSDGLRKLYHARPLTQALGCAPPWPVVDGSHRRRFSRSSVCEAS